MSADAPHHACDPAWPLSSPHASLPLRRGSPHVAGNSPSSTPDPRCPPAHFAVRVLGPPASDEPPSILYISCKSAIARLTRTAASEARTTPIATATSSQHASLHPPRDQRAAAAIEPRGSLRRITPHSSHRARHLSVLAAHQHAIARDCGATYLEQSACAHQRRKHAHAARRHSFDASSSQARTSTDTHTRAPANALARTRAHTHTRTRAHTYTQRSRHTYIERETRARTSNHAADSSAALATHTSSPLSLSPSRRPALTRSARHIVAPARARCVWGGAESKLAACLAQRWARETERREPGRADAARRCRRGCASWRHAAIRWRLLRVTSARSGRGAHGLRAAARTQARRCSCDRREVVCAILASASNRCLSRRMAADVARAQTHGPQRHAHPAHDAALMAWCGVRERMMSGSPSSRRNICVCHATTNFMWISLRAKHSDT